MKLRGLRALVAVVDHGSFSAAALELGMAQSSVSHAIAELEDELAVKLLERGRFGAVPTDIGARVAAHARRVGRTLEAIEEEAAVGRGQPGGVVRISTFRSIANHVLAPTLNRLRSTDPKLRVEVEELAGRWTDAADLLQESRVDLALTIDSVADYAIFWELLRDRYVAVVPASAKLDPGPLALEAVLEGSVLLNDGPCSWPIRERIAEIDPVFQPDFAISDDSTILAFVAQGLGVALMPVLTVDGPPPGTEVVELTERIERVMGVALLPASLKVPAVRTFLAALRQLFPDGEVPVLDSRSASLPEAVTHLSRSSCS